MTYNPNFSSISTVAASGSVSNTVINNTGGPLSKLTPIRIDSSGDMAIINVSIEADIEAMAGITASDTLNGEIGDIANSGRMVDITTSFALGSPIYLSKAGGLTDIKPSIGVSGFISSDFVVRVGIIAKNNLDPLKKDLLININLVGQL